MNEVSRLQMKVQALREGSAERFVKYEDIIADLRIELTEQAQRLQELNDQNINLQGVIEDLRQKTEREDVVQEEAGAPEAPADNSNDSN